MLLEWMNYYGVEIGVKMSNPPIIVVDADAIIAQTDSQDPHHKTANVISKKLVEMRARILYPAQLFPKLTPIYKEY